MSDEHLNTSALLRRFLDKWDKEMAARSYEQAAFTSNDIESCGRALANLTHKTYERSMKNGNTTPAAGPDRGPSEPPEKRGGW